MSAVATPTDVATRPWLPPGIMLAATGGPLLLALTNAVVEYLHTRVKVESTADAVRQAAQFPGLNQFQAATGLLAALLLVPAVWGATALLSARTPRLAAVGGWLMASGYVLFTALAVDSLTLAAVAAGGDSAGYVDAVDNHTPLVTMLMYGVFGLGALLGGLILGIAMLRQSPGRGGAVPVWAGWALIASEPVRIAGLMIGVPYLPAVASLLIAAAFVGVLRSRA